MRTTNRITGSRVSRGVQQGVLFDVITIENDNVREVSAREMSLSSALAYMQGYESVTNKDSARVCRMALVLSPATTSLVLGPTAGQLERRLAIAM